MPQPQRAVLIVSQRFSHAPGRRCGRTGGSSAYLVGAFTLFGSKSFARVVLPRRDLFVVSHTELMLNGESRKCVYRL